MKIDKHKALDILKNELLNNSNTKVTQEIIDAITTIEKSFNQFDLLLDMFEKVTSTCE